MSLCKQHRRTFWRWSAMIQRCVNENNVHFQNYGGRGISVCERWRTFANFFADMGDPPCREMTLERIDNDGGYCPANCKWVSRRENNSNRRSCRIVNHNGFEGTMKEVWRKFAHPEITYRRMMTRIDRDGWPLDKALVCPPNATRGQNDSG